MRLELATGATQLEALETLLSEHGAAAITLLSDQDEPVLEPEPGTTPLWQNIQVSALLPLETDLTALRAQIDAASLAEVRDVAFADDDDWQNASNNYAVDALFGERLWLRPRDAQSNAEDARPVLLLEPGLAFGSGSHPTTHMCLEWLAVHVEPGQRVLDFGCGSGVLALAGALLGAAVVAVDHDPQAILATLDNAAYNEVAAHEGELAPAAGALGVLDATAWQRARPSALGTFDVLIANILAAPIKAMAAEFEAAVRPGGAIVLSGILDHQADSVAASYSSTTFSRREMAEWVCLEGVRRA